MNDLVPFEFESLKAAEAAWVDPRTVRFPRAEVGRIFRGDHTPRGGGNDRRVIDKVIARQPHLKEMGIPLALRGLTGSPGDREYTAICYSLDEIHELAAYSQLPGARNFIHIYPRLKEAEVLGRFQRVWPRQIREQVISGEIQKVLATPEGTPERWQARAEAAKALGRSKSTVQRYIKDAAAGVRPPWRKGRSDPGSFRKFPQPLQAKALRYLRENPAISTHNLQQFLDNHIGYSTLRRWRAQALLGERAA